MSSVGWAGSGLCLEIRVATDTIRVRRAATHGSRASRLACPSPLRFNIIGPSERIRAALRATSAGRSVNASNMGRYQLAHQLVWWQLPDAGRRLPRRTLPQSANCAPPGGVRHRAAGPIHPASQRCLDLRGPWAGAGSSAAQVGLWRAPHLRLGRCPPVLICATVQWLRALPRGRSE
jgi:hypothetical protein